MWMMWFVKSKRAQSETDYETWVEGEVAPTLNAFDLGDTRATTVILFEATRVEDVRIYDRYSPTVATYWGTGGARVPYVFPIQDGREVEKKQNGLGVGNDGDPAYTIDTVSHQAVVMRDREGKAGGGKGPLVSDKAFTLATSNFHTVFPSPTQVRRLTPTECERLQGFPDGWTEGQADSNRYKQMGNAVAVPVVEWIIGRLVEADGQSI